MSSIMGHVSRTAKTEAAPLRAYQVLASGPSGREECVVMARSRNDAQKIIEGRRLRVVDIEEWVPAEAT